MYRNIYKWLLLFTIPAVMGSCNKWLDLKPSDGIVKENFWKTKEQLGAAVNGIYAAMINNTTNTSDRAVAEYMFMWGELRADMVMPSTGATNEDIDIYNVNLLSTNTITNWRVIYRVINYCNTVIHFAPAVMNEDNTLTQQQLDNYMSEAYTIRALMYFYLVRSFGDVPLKLTATTSDDELEQLVKSPKDSVLKQIVADLTKAEPIAVSSYGNKPYDKGRVTKYTVNAIQADVYLWMDKYNDCITACNKLINSGQYGLISSGNWIYSVFIEGNSSESVFELQYNKQAQNPFYNIFMSSRRRYQATLSVMESIYTIDYVNADSVDRRGDGISLLSSSSAIVKFIFNATSDASYNHWILYRYSDILLMKAEALNQLERGQEALDIVYQVRRRAHALAATDLSPGADDQDGITDFILAERAREFAFEGKRWYDILRNAKRDGYRRSDILTTMVINSVVPERQQSAISKYGDHNSHYFPIYIYELQTDKNLVQNPFYQ
ncbi:MAG: RagB/SusD family nutrient uptake outer membrane protein [Chitinophagaceae bacterium]